MIRIEPRSAVVFAAALASSLACAGALRWMDGAGEAQAASATPSVARSADGHYWAEADVNGARVRFLVDTGASAVALTLADAKRLGIATDKLSYSYRVMTAAGEARAAQVTLGKVSVAGTQLRDVEALVIDKGLDSSLLGMTYLGRLASFEATRTSLILRP